MTTQEYGTSEGPLQVRQDGRCAVGGDLVVSGGSVVGSSTSGRAVSGGAR